eukprot:gnl/TRDRNA2_/TRDRNA2_169687_c0_seq2.p1 gnl/TRDRNA2_/TRDRNA2_169687_c0~~gnl/TRDRNA2_/TRDRNA2_169687_c0_seq2.p1  ORF type:complete len:424 (+),score=37.38 gnl/TRDRNA2_/TRDRNA2_169687_c0_seq2:53-1273(+)
MLELGSCTCACSVVICAVAVGVGFLWSILHARGMLSLGTPVPAMDMLTKTPTHHLEQSVAEIVAKLETPSGNIAVSSTGRVLFNFHPAYSEPSGAKFAEVISSTGSWKSRRDLDTHVHTVLSLRIDSADRLYLLDHAGDGFGGTPKLVVFQLANTSQGTDDFLYEYKFPSSIAGVGSMLNDLNISPDGTAVYIADTSVMRGTPALVVCSTGMMRAGDPDACRRRLQLHHSVVAESLDAVVNGNMPVQLLGLHVRIAVDSIALDRRGEWLYYGPLTSTTLWRVPSVVLHDSSASNADVEAVVERYAEKPISDGISIDDDGNVFLTALEHSAVAVIRSGPAVEERSLDIVMRDPKLLQWPDGLSFGPEGWLYVTCSALHHKFSGSNMTQWAPYNIVRMKMPVGATPGQ